MRHYLANGGNGTQAAIAAGYSAKGAAVAASKLLKRPAVVEEIQRLGGSATPSRRRQHTEDRQEQWADNLIRLDANELKGIVRRKLGLDGPEDALVDEKAYVKLLELAMRITGLGLQPKAKVDLGKLSSEQLRRFAEGEPLAEVLANP